VRLLTGLLEQQAQGYMLNPGIANALQQALQQRSATSTIDTLTGGADAPNPLQPNNSLMRIAAADFIATPELLEEIFGPVSLLVECQSVAEMQQVAEAMEGNLTATLHIEDENDPAVKPLLRQLSRVAGRVLFNGYPTGVEVCPAMQHGGPYPASSAPATTSVGTAAITRFTRRCAFQNCPAVLLPAALQDNNPLGITREINGELTQAAI